MVRAIKSVLLLDYDGVHRALSRYGAAIADYLGARAGTWLEAVETGELLAPREETRRRFVIKRCYADPKLMGKNRGWMSANGVQIVACAPTEGVQHGAAVIHMVLDAMEAMDPPPDEYVLLTPDIDLSPLIARLKANKRRVVVFATDGTSEIYRSLVDAVIEEDHFVSIISRQTQGAPRATARGDIPRPPRIGAITAGPRHIEFEDEEPPVPVPMPEPTRSGSPRGVARAPSQRPAPVAAPPQPAPVARQQAAVAARPQPAPVAARPQPVPAAARPLPEPAPAPQQPERRNTLPARRAAIDREELAGLVRRIHQATNVPLFSPKAFADLFRLLVEDVAEYGYKFQATSDSVAAAMNALGRNVSKRQVGFVIKGLALRGHVFGEDDHPEDLAHSFYEQVLFLTENAGIVLSPGEKGLVHAWVVGIRREEPAARSAPTPPPQRGTTARQNAAPRSASGRPRDDEPIVTPPPARAAAPPTRRPEHEPSRGPQRMPEPPPSIAVGRSRAAAARAAEEAARVAAARAAEEEAARIEAEAVAAEEEAARLEAEAVAAEEEAARREAEAAAEAAAAEEEAAFEAEQAAIREAQEAAFREAEEEARLAEEEEARLAAEEAQRIEAASRRRGPRSVLAQRAAQNGVSIPARRASPLPPVEAARREAALEDSILSAIADAVDVLVDDEAPPPALAEPTDSQLDTEVSPVREEDPANYEPVEIPPVRPVSTDPDNDEIGDEIQRILSTFSQNR